MPNEDESYSRQLLSPRNIIIYIIVAIILYGGAVLLVNRSGSYLPAGAPLTSSETKINLNAENSSAENGTATLAPVNNGSQTQVTIELSNEPGTPQPAHIHIGSCPNVGDIKYPLNDVVNGKSVTTVNVPYDSLKAMLPLAINAHLSSADINTYVSCGDITF